MGSGGKSGSQTIGFRYYFSILVGLGRGPLDEIVEMKAADKTAWQGPARNADGAEVVAINAENLFGGEEKEGGILGGMRIFWGEEDQEVSGSHSYTPVSSGGGSGGGGGGGFLVGGLLGGLLFGGSGGGASHAGAGLGIIPSLTTSIGGLVPALRGVTTLWFDGMIGALNPYPKDWKFRVRRSRKGWWKDQCWYPEKARILMAGGSIHAMNPAHIIYECTTNPEWGNGIPVALLDENSFIRAANQLCAEEFGLCIAWLRKEDIDVFIQSIVDHIGAAFYTDRETGLLTLRLIRDDYNDEDLPLFTPETGLIAIVEDDTSSSDTQFSEVIVTFRDPITNEDGTARAQNLGALAAQGSLTSYSVTYQGIPTKDLAGRVATRELKAQASGLARYTIKLDRSGWRIAPGMPFRVRDLKRGIESVTLRASEIDDSSLTQGVITIKAVQDVFGLPDTALTVPQDGNGWTPPASTALPSPNQRLLEMTYYDLVRLYSEADLAQVATTDVIVATVADAPNRTTFQYELVTKADGETDYVSRGTNSLTASASLVVAIGPLDTNIVLANANGFPSSVADQTILIDDERCVVTAYNATTGQATIGRGAVDTIPASHASNATVWFPEDDVGLDSRKYAPGETVDAKVLTKTSSDILALDTAAELSVTAVGRFGRPYPVADLRVNGDSIYSLTDFDYPEPQISWTTRNRLTQQDQIVTHGEPSVAPEAGTTFTVRIFNTAGTTMLRETTGLATSPWTYTAAMQTADGNPADIFIDVVAVRDGLESWAKYHLPVKIRRDTGYGLSYGYAYGGD